MNIFYATQLIKIGLMFRDMNILKVQLKLSSLSNRLKSIQLNLFNSSPWD